MGGLGAGDELNGDAVIQLALEDPQLHRVLLDGLTEGVCMVDRDHRILYWNRAAERVSGYLAQEVAGQFSHGDLLMHCADDGSLLPGTISAAAAVLVDGEHRQSTVFLKHRDGYRLLVELESRPIRDRDGAVVGALEVFEEAAVPPIHRRPPMESFGCSDSGTRAGTREYGEMRARHSLEAFDQFGIPFGWLRVGLDGAAELDRGYGHAMVTAAVKMIAATLDRNLAPRDVLSRWAADEFRVIVHGCSRSELAAAAERLRLLVSTSTLEWWGDPLRITVSLGGAAVESGDTVESLEKRVGEVFEGCQAGGGDRSAVAHVGMR